MRLTPASRSGATTVPVVIDTALAGLLDVGVGDRFTLQLTRDQPAAAGNGCPGVVVAARRPATPKAFADLRTVVEHLLRTTDGVPGANQIWLSSLAAPTQVLDVVPPTMRLISEHSTAELVRPAQVSYWCGAVGALLLAMAVGTLAATLSRERGEVGAPRVLGLTATQQASSRRRFVGTVAVKSVSESSSVSWWATRRCRDWSEQR